MERKIVNPWTWQDSRGFVQANVVTGAEKIIFCAGQAPVDENGNVLYAGDMAKQMDKVFDNIQTILDQTGADWPNVMRLTVFVNDVDKFMEASAVFRKRLADGKCRPATSLIGVAELFHPDCMIEIEATITM